MPPETLQPNPQTQAQLWTEDCPQLDHQPSAALGTIQAETPADLSTLLTLAIQRANELNLKHLLAPLNGSTWRSYRLVTEDLDHSPPFPGEPATPAWWPAVFASHQFQPIAHYRSWKLNLTQTPNLLEPSLQQRLSRRGLTLRPLDLNHFDEEIARLFPFAAEAFADARFQTPISQSEFQTRLEALRPLLNPELILLAEDAQGQLVGFLFAYPEGPAQPNQSRPAVILKTLAVAANQRRSGLAILLVDTIHQRARELGYTQTIHALQRDDNPVTRLSEKYRATLLRRYQLLARRL